jgi:hypothetical protein
MNVKVLILGVFAMVMSP